MIIQEIGGVYVAWDLFFGIPSAGTGDSPETAFKKCIDDAIRKHQGSHLYRPDTGVIGAYAANRQQQGVQR